MSAGPLSNVACTVWLAVDSAESLSKRGVATVLRIEHEVRGFFVDEQVSNKKEGACLRLFTCRPAREICASEECKDEG